MLGNSLLGDNTTTRGCAHRGGNGPSKGKDFFQVSTKEVVVGGEGRERKAWGRASPIGDMKTSKVRTCSLHSRNGTPSGDYWGGRWPVFRIAKYAPFIVVSECVLL